MRVALGPAAGLRLEADPDVPLTAYLGIFEWELDRHVRALCRPGTRAFDVGGYNGYYALAFSRLSGAPVICLDSDEAACDRIRRTCRANGHVGARILVRETYAAWEINEAQNCTTLDALAAERDGFVPDLVKIDVEGAELSVLGGMPELLAQRRPHLIVEVHSAELERQCGDLLLSQGYAPLVVTQRRRARQRGRGEHNRWLVARGREA